MRAGEIGHLSQHAPPPSHETGDSNDERADDDDDALSKHERRLVQRAISG